MKLLSARSILMDNIIRNGIALSLEKKFLKNVKEKQLVDVIMRNFLKLKWNLAPASRLATFSQPSPKPSLKYK